jgi:hypothetical protein
MPNQDQSLQLEVSKVEALTAHYPAGTRESACWLAAFLRERCSRNISALAAIIKKRGWDTHETTLSRILRGKLMDDSGAPCIKLKTFAQIIEALRQEDQLAQLAGRVPFIETTTWDDIRNYIDFKRAPETVCKFGLIIGPTGSQKSACGKQYVMRNNHGVCVHIESPETPTMGKFITKLGRAYGVSEFHNLEKKRERIIESVNDRSTIIVDNIQRMYKDRRGWDQPIFNYLQQLQDDTNCTIILICVPEFEFTLQRGMDRGYFEQFEGRVGGASEFLILPEYPPSEDVLAIAETFKLADAEKHLAELESICRRRGRIRILFNALQKAQRDAGTSRLTIKHVRLALKDNSKED